MGVIDQQKTFDESKPNSAPTWGNGYAIPQFQPNTAVNANAQPLQGPSTLENQQQTATISTDASQLQGKKPYNANFNVFARSPQANTNPNLGGQAVVNMNPKVNTGSVQGTQPKTEVVPEGQNGNFVQNAQTPNATLQGVKVPTLQQQASQPMNYQQFRDAMFGSEEEKRKKANNRAKVLAIGDALRHIGNLAYVSGMGPGAGGAFASPQQYKTAPAGEEVAKYEAGKKERDAMGWQEMQYAQKRKQQELENELARQKMYQDQYNKDRDYELKVGDFKLKVAKNGREAAEAEQKLKNMIAQHDYYLAQGDYQKARAVKAQIEAEWEPKQQAATLAKTQAQTRQANSAANNSDASAKLNRIKANQADRDSKFRLPTRDPNKMYAIPKSDMTVVGNALKGIASKNKWKGTDSNGSAIDLGNNSKVTPNDLLVAAYEHIDDPEVQQLLNRYGETVDSNYEESDGSHHLD